MRCHGFQREPKVWYYWNPDILLLKPRHQHLWFVFCCHSKTSTISHLSWGNMCRVVLNVNLRAVGLFFCLLWGYFFRGASVWWKAMHMHVWQRERRMQKTIAFFVSTKQLRKRVKTHRRKIIRQNSSWSVPPQTESGLLNRWCLAVLGFDLSEVTESEGGPSGRRSDFKFYYRSCEVTWERERTRGTSGSSSPPSSSRCTITDSFFPSLLSIHPLFPPIAFPLASSGWLILPQNKTTLSGSAITFLVLRLLVSLMSSPLPLEAVAMSVTEHLFLPACVVLEITPHLISPR